MNRSPSGAKLWNEFYNDETDYAGIYGKDFKDKIEWADLIIVMEEHQRKFIAENYPKLYLQKKILCFDIPDIYDYMSPELVEMLKVKFKELKILF